MTDYRLQFTSCHSQPKFQLNGATDEQIALLAWVRDNLAEWASEADDPSCVPQLDLIRLYNEVPVGTIARIRVQNTKQGEVTAIVERVENGWQSGVHHYDDEMVRKVEIVVGPDGDPMKVVES